MATLHARFAFALLLAGLGGCAATTAPKAQSHATACELVRGDCTPEEACDHTLAELAAGAALRLDCGITATPDDVSQHACRRRVEQLFEQWHAKDPGIAIPAASSVHVVTAQTCLDTFVPGREAADCAFFRVGAEVVLPARPAP